MLQDIEAHELRAFTRYIGVADPRFRRLKILTGHLKNGGGYDHNWVLNKKSVDEWGLDLTLSDPASGRTLEIYSDEPGMQFYSGNFLTGKVEGKGVKFEYRGAVVLEPQHYPDTPNQPKFPTTLLKPGEEYKSKITYKFVTK